MFPCQCFVQRNLISFRPYRIIVKPTNPSCTRVYYFPFKLHRFNSSLDAIGASSMTKFSTPSAKRVLAADIPATPAPMINTDFPGK